MAYHPNDPNDMHELYSIVDALVAWGYKYMSVRGQLTGAGVTEDDELVAIIRRADVVQAAAPHDA